MGDILKSNYEMHDLVKSFVKINRVFDEDYQKLSDKYKNLTLSHNRKVKLLDRVLDLDICNPGFVDEFRALCELIKSELCFNGRVRFRLVDSKKGGKK